MHLGEAEPTVNEPGLFQCESGGQKLVGRRQDSKLVLQGEWVQLGRGKRENVPSGRQGRGQAGAGGRGVDGWEG